MRKLAPKVRGELAEIKFLLAAASRGFTVAKPWGDSLPFDFLVGNNGRYLRVQVKSTRRRLGRSRYNVHCNRPSGNRPYTSRQIDVLVAYVVPEDKWFVIPVREIGNIVQFSVSCRPGSRGRLDRFLDAWHILR